MSFMVSYLPVANAAANWSTKEMAKTTGGENYIGIRVSEEILEQLQYICKANDRNYSSQVRTLIRQEYLTLTRKEQDQ
jgi:hypothetical protein